MLINDFLKLSSATLPNDNLVKIAMNERFNANIIKKNVNEIFVRNKGIIIEENEVAKTQA